MIYRESESTGGVESAACEGRGPPILLRPETHDFSEAQRPPLQEEDPDCVL